MVEPRHTRHSFAQGPDQRENRVSWAWHIRRECQATSRNRESPDTIHGNNEAICFVIERLSRASIFQLYQVHIIWLSAIAGDEAAGWVHHIRASYVYTHVPADCGEFSVVLFGVLEALVETLGLMLRARGECCRLEAAKDQVCVGLRC